MQSNILFEHQDWTSMPQPPDNCECGWTNNQGLVIALSHFGADKGLRDQMSDIRTVRDHYRTAFAEQGAGLIECDLLELDGVPAVRAIGKIILQPSGAAYAATIALPLPKESYVFNLAAKEVGISGMRETAVMLKTIKELEKQGYALAPTPEETPDKETDAGKASIFWKNAVTGAVLNWAEDPYDPKYNGPCLRNLADAPEHDRIFAQHPLSRIRAALQCLVDDVKLSDELKKRAAE